MSQKGSGNNKSPLTTSLTIKEPHLSPAHCKYVSPVGFE